MGKKSDNTKNSELNFLYFDPIEEEKEEKKKKKNKRKKEKKETEEIKDNEIIIGVTLPEEEKTKKKRKKQKQKKKPSSSITRKEKPDEMVVEVKTENKRKNRADKKSAQKDKKIEQEETIEKKGRAKSIVKWIFLGFTLIAAMLFVMLSPVFNVVEITVKGNEKISQETIISLSGIQLEENLYKTSSRTIYHRIKENSYMDTVKVIKHIPNRIEIRVKERKTTYMLQVAGSYAYINNQGYILELSDQKQEVPILTGFSIKEEDIQTGVRLPQADLEKLEVILKVMESASGNGIANLITQIEVSDIQDIILRLEEEKKNIYLGTASNLSKQMWYIKVILEKEKGIEGDIFVNGDLNKSNPYFREKV